MCKLCHKLGNAKNWVAIRITWQNEPQYRELTTSDGNKQIQTLQSHIQDSVENKETHEETQGQANHKSRKASASGFAAPDPSTGPETPTEEILTIPIW